MSNAMKTRTGGFTIGFRYVVGTEWEEELDGVIAWAKENGFGAMDVRPDADAAKKVADAGLRPGTVDLPDWQGMISADKAKRADAVAANAELIKACAGLGPINYFALMLPEAPDLPRPKNFDFMVEAYSELLPVAEECHARISVEGWPGPGALCCTPETYRALLKECPSEAMGVNYDPSHLIRMGIDPLRFLGEFGERVCHMHGKDADLMPDRLYDLGTEQPATFADGIRFGGTYWRYTIPGHGQARWLDIFRLLQDAGYGGCVCIELEDANFNGTEAEAKSGLIQGGHFLQGC